jgi:O-antigen/teichoic acid export membrane protein
MLKINKNFGWLLNNYITYILTFITSIIIAKKLGTANFGQWSTVNLIIAYITQLNFGITHSFYNIVLSKKMGKDETLLYLSNSIFLLLILSLIWILLYFSNFYFKFIQIEFLYKPIGLFIVLSSIFALYNALLSNYFRIYNNLKILMIVPYISPLLFLLSIILINNKYLIEGLIYSLLISNFITFLLLFIKFNISIKNKIIIEILKTSFLLFLYNTSFYFLLILTRTYYSFNTTLYDFGIFSFSLTLANAFFLFLESISFLSQTKLIYIMSKVKNNELAFYLINKIRNISVVFNYSIIFCVLLISPIFFYFFPEYNNSLNLFKYLLLINLILSNSGAMLLYMMSKLFLNNLTFYSLTALLILIIISSVITFFKLNSIYFLLSLFCTYLLLGILITRFSLKKLGINKNIINLLYYYFPPNLLIPFIIFFLSFYTNYNTFSIFGFIVFIVMNKIYFNNIIYLFKKILTNSDYFTIK